MKTIKLLIIGAIGHQGKEYIDIITKEFNEVDIVGLVDINTDELEILSMCYGIPFFSSIDQALSLTDFDVALITLPHHLHFDVTSKLLKLKKHIIKEKPFALNAREAHILNELTIAQDVSLFIVTQRKFQESFVAAYNALKQIGHAYSFTYTYLLNLPKQTAGWRANRDLSGGGVVLDMGYHTFDVINRFFGKPSEVFAGLSYCYEDMLHHKLEDSANVSFKYETLNLQGSVLLGRHHYIRREQLEISGTDGALVIEPSGYKLYSREGALLENYIPRMEKGMEKLIMLREYFHNIENRAYREEHLQVNMMTIDLIDKVYALGLGQDLSYLT